MLKRRCTIETKRRCEMVIKAEIDEFTRQVKSNQMVNESDLSMKIELLRQIMQELLEPITFTEKESFIAVKCAEMATMANKHMLQE